ncbi:MAG: FKBP-type peptidyl-prolyl cis-trans isomerase [Salibacteraceae bacterium]
MGIVEFSNKKLNSLIVIMALVLSVSCQEDKTTKALPISDQELREKLIEANIRRVQAEKVDIDSLITAKGWNMDTTGTGLRIEIYENGNGDSVKVNRMVEVEYTITMLNGDTVYTSNNQGSKQFKVGMDHIETGIHEAVTYMRVGDKSRVILPSHLAHGFMGDDQSIPPNASLIYHLQILSVQ